ncbi:hypothetical protein D3C76_1370620 [compost metagenome]
MAASCIGRFSGAVRELKVPPMRPAAISSRIFSWGISGPMLIRRSWPIFSASVIWLIRWSMNACLSCRGGAEGAARAA